MPKNTPESNASVDAPETWVERHGDYLFRYALQRVGDTGDAEELVQETLLAALQSYERFDGRAQFRTWLTAILRRKIADEYRRQTRQRRRDDERFEEQTDGLFGSWGKWKKHPKSWKASAYEEHDGEDGDLNRTIMTCLDKLPAHVADMFVMHEHRSVPPEEIANDAGITPGNLSVRLYRARLALRECLNRNWFTRSRP